MKPSNERATLGSPQNIMWTSKEDKTKIRRDEVEAVEGEVGQNVVIKQAGFRSVTSSFTKQSGLSEFRSVAPVEGL